MNYSTHFPSGWTLGDENEPAPSRPLTPALTPIPKPWTDTPPSVPPPALVVPVDPSHTNHTFSKYISHFPSTWALPTSSSPSPSPSPHSLAPSTSVPRVITDERNDHDMSTERAAWCGPQSQTTSKQRTATAHDLGPQIALWRRRRQVKPQTFPAASDNPDRLENFRRSLFAQLSQIILENTRRMEGEDDFNRIERIDTLRTLLGAGIRSDPINLVAGSSEVTSNGRSDEDTGEIESSNWYEDGSGDVPHQALAISDAYSVSQAGITTNDVSWLMGRGTELND